MCYQGKDLKMVPLQETHLELIKLELDQKTADFADTTFRAWTKHLVPHLPILPMFTAMYELWQNRDFGVLGEYDLVRTPLSIIGADKIRYRTPIISLLHETVLSARMSDISVETFRKDIHKRDVCIMYLCSCGVVLGSCEDVANFYGSELHSQMDLLRSAIDAEGNPIKEVELFNDLPVQNMDLHVGGADLRLLQRIEELTRIAAKAEISDLKWIDVSLSEFIWKAQGDYSKMLKIAWSKFFVFSGH